MKRIVSFKEFVTTLGLGLWQVLCFIGRAFNYKNKTPFWRIVWGIITVCIVIFTSILCYEYYIHEIKRSEYSDCKRWLSEDVYAYKEYDADFHSIHSKKTGKVTLEKINWYVAPTDNDSLAVFAQKGKRGYFNINTGEVAISPIYRKAWVFSDGVAAVLKGDSIYFIDHTANPLFGFPFIKKDTHFYQNSNTYCFHHNRCVMYNENHKYGLIDLNGKWIIAPEYDDVSLCGSTDSLYILKNRDRYGLANANGKLKLACIYKEIEVADSGIFVSLEDNTQRRLDFDGNMTDEFMCYSIANLEYNLYIKTENSEDMNYVTQYANLLSYTERSGYMGLMDKNGRRITSPKYKSIKAINADLYRCGYDDQLDNAVLINGKGEVLKVDN